MATYMKKSTYAHIAKPAENLLQTLKFKSPVQNAEQRQKQTIAIVDMFQVTKILKMQPAWFAEITRHKKTTRS